MRYFHISADEVRKMKQFLAERPFDPSWAMMTLDGPIPSDEERKCKDYWQTLYEIGEIEHPFRKQEEIESAKQSLREYPPHPELEYAVRVCHPSIPDEERFAHEPQKFLQSVGEWDNFPQPTFEELYKKPWIEHSPIGEGGYRSEDWIREMKEFIEEHPIDPKWDMVALLKSWRLSDYEKFARWFRSDLRVIGEMEKEPSPYPFEPVRIEYWMEFLRVYPVHPELDYAVKVHDRSVPKEERLACGFQQLLQRMGVPDAIPDPYPAELHKRFLSDGLPAEKYYVSSDEVQEMKRYLEEHPIDPKWDKAAVLQRTVLPEHEKTARRYRWDLQAIGELPPSPYPFEPERVAYWKEFLMQYPVHPELDHAVETGDPSVPKKEHLARGFQKLLRKIGALD